MNRDVPPNIEDLPDEVREFLAEHGVNEPNNPRTIAWLIFWCVREIVKLKVSRG